MSDVFFFLRKEGGREVHDQRQNGRSEPHSFHVISSLLTHLHGEEVHFGLGGESAGNETSWSSRGAVEQNPDGG